MLIGRVKCLMVAAFSVLDLTFSTSVFSQEGHVTHGEAGHVEKLDAAKVIMEHIMDNHEYHFAEINGHPVSIPLPVILYSPQRGFDAFMSSKLEHGHTIYNGYKLEEGKIVPVNDNGSVDEGVKVYDFSLTRFVVQLFLSALILIIIMTNVAKT